MSRCIKVLVLTAYCGGCHLAWLVRMASRACSSPNRGGE
jgi:hypothetical protein